MTLSVHLILLLLAFIMFLLAALNISSTRINLVALGLALWVLATLVPPLR